MRPGSSSVDIVNFVEKSATIPLLRSGLYSVPVFYSSICHTSIGGGGRNVYNVATGILIDSASFFNLKKTTCHFKSYLKCSLNNFVREPYCLCYWHLRI